MPPTDKVLEISLDSGQLKLDDGSGSGPQPAQGHTFQKPAGDVNLTWEWDASSTLANHQWVVMFKKDSGSPFETPGGGGPWSAPMAFSGPCDGSSGCGGRLFKNPTPNPKKECKYWIFVIDLGNTANPVKHQVDPVIALPPE